MAKITFVKINGKNYPMSFSLGASKKLMQKYGSLDGLRRAISAEEKDEAGEEDDVKTEQLDVVMEILEILIAQGCGYKNFFEKDLPTPEGAPIVDGKWMPITKEGMEYAVDVSDMEELVLKIEQCISASSKKTVEGKATGKNA